MAAIGGEVKVVGYLASPMVMRPRIALNLKSVAHEFLQETFGSKSELLIKSNPVYKRIPVLIHDGKPMCESIIMVEYIDEVWAHSGHSILPSDPYDRAIARFWAFYIDDKILPAIKETGMGPEKGRAESAELLLDGMQLLEEAFVKCSKGKPFFGGDSIGYLDIALGSMVGWLRAVGKISGKKFLDEGKTPLLVEWAERFCAEAAVKEVMHETDMLVEFAKVLEAKFRATPPAKWHPYD